MGLPEQGIRNLRCKAVGEMSALYRNAHGTKELALQYGYSREEVKKVFEKFAGEIKNEGNHRPLEPC